MGWGRRFFEVATGLTGQGLCWPWSALAKGWFEHDPVCAGLFWFGHGLCWLLARLVIGSCGRAMGWPLSVQGLG
jgi:hypothetical protein